MSGTSPTVLLSYVTSRSEIEMPVNAEVSYRDGGNRNVADVGRSLVNDRRRARLHIVRAPVGIVEVEGVRHKRRIDPIHRAVTHGDLRDFAPLARGVS